MSRHYPPASLRYLKARLWNLARPSFWGTAIFLAVVGMGLYEYWTNPDFLEWQEESVNSSNLEDSSISDADKSILADVDNLSVLLNDRAKTNSLSTAPISIPKPQKGNNKSLLNDLNKASKNFINQTKSEPGVVNSNPGYNLQIENPFLTQAENLLKGNNSQAQNNLLGGNAFPGNYLNPQVTTTPTLRVDLYGKTSTSAYIPTTSPLQAAINKSLQPDQTNPVNIGKSGNNFSVNNPLNQPGVNNPGIQSPGINNLSGVTGVTSYNQPLQTKQQPNTSHFSSGYIQPKLTNRQLNQPNTLGNQQFNQGYSQPKPIINLNPTQQSSMVPIQSQLKQQQQIPTQPLPQVTSPSTNYSRPPANQGISQPNNYDNTVWEQLIPRSQYNQIESQSSNNN